MKLFDSILNRLHRFAQARDRRRGARPPHPMDCAICGDPGLYCFRGGGRRPEWYCNTCRPPFLVKTPASLAGDPGHS